MDVDLLTQATSMMAARTQGLAQIKMLKVQHEMEMDMIARLGEAIKAAPPPGTGTRVDKTA
jgi:Putative motility protein